MKRATITSVAPRRRAPSPSSPAKSPEPAFSPPYSPSWVDGLTAWVDRLPGPTWAFYVLVGGAYSLLFLLVEAGLGAGDSARLLPRIFLALQPVYFLAVIHTLDRVAQDAVHRYFAFRPEASAEA